MHSFLRESRYLVDNGNGAFSSLGMKDTSRADTPLELLPGISMMNIINNHTMMETKRLQLDRNSNICMRINCMKCKQLVNLQMLNPNEGEACTSARILIEIMLSLF